MPIVTLRPNGPFHVGQDIGVERQKVYIHVPSDTLFGALVTAWAQLGQADNVIRAFDGQPPFILSSAFPCLMAKDKGSWQVVVRLLPVPMVKLPPDQALPPKQKKRLRWVSWQVFEKLCAAQPLDDEISDENFAQGKTIWLMKQERAAIVQAWRRDDIDTQPWWVTSVVPRVTVDRLTNASNLFHVGRVAFAEGMGLWFALRGNGNKELLPEYAGLVKQALRILADAGLGGLRSTGHGAFEWDWEDMDPLSPPILLSSAEESEEYAVTLSRYAPKDADEIARALQTRGASYQLVNLAGWCHDDALHPWRRKRVRLVAEGSVIGCKENWAGKLVDVKPSGAPQAQFGGRGVYRYGYAFPVSVRKEALREVPHE